MKKLLTLVITGLLFLSACSTAKNVATSSTALYETKWLLKKIHMGSTVENVNTKAFIRFDAAKGSAGGNGSCNSFGSNAAVNGNEVKFSNVFSTKMYCEAVQQVEDKFLGGLEKVTQYKIAGKTLKLYNGNDLLLEFDAE
mgnify:CR=1 FL=1